MKKLAISFLVLFLICLASFVYWYFIVRGKYLTNVEELYSLFTPYMEKIVKYYLQLIKCKPKRYYYNNSTFCFVCDLGHACFKFAWVERTEGKKMNPYGKPRLIKIKEFNTQVADFYTDNLASAFNCQKENANRLKCEDSLVFVMNDSNVNIFLNNLENVEKVAKRICNTFNTKFVECKNFVCKCESRGVGIKVNPNNGKIDYYLTK